MRLLILKSKKKKKSHLVILIKATWSDDGFLRGLPEPNLSQERWPIADLLCSYFRTVPTIPTQL